MQGHQLIIPAEINYSQLETHIQNGAKFRIYSYTISLFFTITLKRLSPAILILDNEGKSYQKKYNNLTRCFGWWGIPWGPIHSIKSLRTNKSGGIDVTDDILLNLDEEAWNRRLVELRKITQLFIKPSKAEHKAFEKSFSELLDKLNLDLYIGLYLNVEGEGEPYYMIGIKSANKVEVIEEKVRHALSKQFRKDVFFQFLNLNLEEYNELGTLLSEQGVHFSI